MLLCGCVEFDARNLKLSHGRATRSPPKLKVASSVSISNTQEDEDQPKLPPDCDGGGHLHAENSDDHLKPSADRHKYHLLAEDGEDQPQLTAGSHGTGEEEEGGRSHGKGEEEEKGGRES